MFCPKCGKEIPDGAVFCSSCGANVGGGPVPGPAKQPSPAGVAFSGLGGFLKSYFVSPVQATRDTLAKKDLATPLILMGAQLIACMLMLLGFCLKISMMSGGYASVPFQVWFLGGLLGDAICVILFVALLFAGAKIMGSTCTFQDVLMTCGCHSVFVTGLMLITFLGFLIAIQLGVWLLIFTLILWIALGVPSFQAVVPEMESGKAWLVYLGVVIVTMLLSMFLINNVLFSTLMNSSFGMGSIFSSMF